MKKISILSVLMVMVAMAFTSCKEDTQPRLEIPTEFVLNTPPFAHQEYLVEEGGSIEFTCSQANYGLGTTPTYTIQVCKDEKFEEGTYKTVEYNTQQAVMTVPAEFFSMAVCELYGWADAKEVTTVPLWVRAVSSIENAPADANGNPQYTIASNPVKLDQVKVYFAVKLPDAIYVIGLPSSWDINDNSMPIFETEIGSRIYKGVISVPEGSFQFRFYDELGDWNWFSIGAQDEDATVDITFTDGEYSGPCFYDPATESAGKGGWACPSWPGGDLEITVNLNDKTVVFQQM